MPLVLAQNEQSAAAVKYDDRLGTSYEFPKKYQKLVRPGEAFVYYRGKRSAAGGTHIPHYFGAGVVGDVTPTDDGRLQCKITGYTAFDENVPLRHDGRYLEPGANGRLPKEVGLHFRTGVRTIDQRTFDTILAAAGLPQKASNKAVTKRADERPLATSEENAKDALYDLAIELATAEARVKWPSAKVFRATAGQYFSLIVRQPDGEKRHIAIKATEHEEPRVQLSRGEVSYSDAHAAAYSLWVFYAMDLKAGTAKLIKRAGRITDDDVDIHAAVHGGRLKNTKGGKMVGPIPD